MLKSWYIYQTSIKNNLYHTGCEMKTKCIIYQRKISEREKKKVHWGEQERAFTKAKFELSCMATTSGAL